MTSRHADALSRRGATGLYVRIRNFRLPRAGLLGLRGLLGRHLSVRAKLTLWYGAMCAVTLTIVGAGMAIYLDRQFATDIDGHLVSSVESVQPVLESGFQPNGAPIPTTCRFKYPAEPIAVQFCAHLQQTINSAPYAITNYGQFETVLFTYVPRGYLTLPGGIIQPFPPSTRPLVPPGIIPTIAQTQQLASFYSAIAAGRPQFASVTFGDQHLRVYGLNLTLPPAILKLRRASEYSAVLVMWQKEGIYDQIKGDFVLVLLVGVPIGLAIALAAGWLIARAALRPIGRISRTVRAIGDSKDLKRRVRFSGPTDELGQLAQTFDDMMDRLENVFENQKRFIADASHELRTPLTAIRGNADLIRRAPPEEREICLTTIRRESERMSRLVNDLLLLAEADVAEQPLDTHPVRLDGLAEEVYRSALPLAGDKVELVLDEIEPLTIDGDADRLKQLLLNLVDNAVKFTPSGGTVSVRVAVDHGNAVLEVSDSGVGIAPEEQAAIFNRFYRVEASRSKTGTGLGLAICAWIAEAHGGTIGVRSRPGKGSTFTVTIPGARRPAA